MPESTRHSSQTTRWRPFAIALGVLAIAVLVWLTFLRDDGEDVAAEPAGRPVVVEPDDLSGVADRLGHPVYWVGERSDVDYELTESDSGRVYVRYLEDGAEAGARSAKYVAVATYPVAGGDAAASIRRAARDKPDAELGRTDDGAVMLIDPGASTSAHIAYPGSEYQIEVYSPKPGEALRLAAKGQIQPVP